MDERTVTTIGDLAARHLGQKVRIPYLHQPGTDWDAPKVAVTGTLDKLSRPGFFSKGQCWVGLTPISVRLDRPLPLTWPCFLVSEDPAAPPAEQDALDGMETQ